MGPLWPRCYTVSYQNRHVWDRAWGFPHHGLTRERSYLFFCFAGVLDSALIFLMISSFQSRLPSSRTLTIGSIAFPARTMLGASSPLLSARRILVRRCSALANIFFSSLLHAACHTLCGWNFSRSVSTCSSSSLCDEAFLSIPGLARTCRHRQAALTREAR